VVNWREARDLTLETWVALGESIGQKDELALLTEINAVCDLCSKARDEAGSDPTGRCEYCLFYQQFGGCHAVNEEMSERVVKGDWDGLRRLVHGFVADLRALELPPGE